MTALLEFEDEFGRYIADPGSFQDPYPVLAAARERGSIHLAAPGLWGVTAYDVGELALRHPSVGRYGAAELEAVQIAGESPVGAEAAEIYLSMFVALDAPDHTRLRRLASPAFRPSIIQQFRVVVDEIVSELIDGMLASGDVDFVRDFAYPLPQTVICRMLGIPPQDEAEWNQWVYTIANVNKASFKEGEPTELREALIGLAGYCRDLVRSRRGRGSDDLIGSLIAIEESGDKLSEDELVGTLVLLIVAGHETTVNLLGSGMYLLASRPEQWQALQQDVELVGPAVEETLRFEPPARVSPRIAMDDVELADEVVCAGERLLVVLPAVNRDPARFDAPDVFDITRKRPTSMAFGYGAHFCLGAPLARLEGAAAFGRLAELDIQLADDQVTWRNAAHRSLESLRVSVAPATR